MTRNTCGTLAPAAGATVALALALTVEGVDHDRHVEERFDGVADLGLRHAEGGDEGVDVLLKKA